MYEYQRPRHTDSLEGKARNNFITKVYTILAIQLTITAISVTLATTSREFLHFVMRNTALFWLCMITSFICLIALACSRQLAKSFPINMVLLGVFTVCESYLVATFTSMYQPESVILAAAATAAATLGITSYALFTKNDFTTFYHSFSAFFVSMFWVIFIVSIINVFFLRISFVSTVISVILAGVYTIYLLIDTQLVLGGGKYEVKMDDYVMASAILYLDIINLFLQLLKILGKKKQ